MGDCSLTKSPIVSGNVSGRKKLTGRKFYESIGSPKLILAPMVDRSEFVGKDSKSMRVLF